MSKFKVGEIVNSYLGKVRIAETDSGLDKIWFLVELLDEGKRGHGHNGNGFCSGYYTGNNMFYMSGTDLKKIRLEEIHITREGNTVHAIMKDNGKVVKRAKAVCNPDDAFDFEIGAKLAVQRLLSEDKPKNDLKGKYVIIADEKKAVNDYKYGDVFQVIEENKPGTLRVRRLRDGAEAGLYKWRFEVLETEDRFAKAGDWVLVTDSFNETFPVGKIVKIGRDETDCEYPFDENGSVVDGCRYLVLKNYKPRKEYPYLENMITGGYYGKLGSPTKIKDVRGDALFVGDVVTIVSKYGRNAGKRFVAETCDGDQFIFGIRSDCNKDGIIENGWIIIKEKGYKALEHGEKYAQLEVRLHD